MVMADTEIPPARPVPSQAEAPRLRAEAVEIEVRSLARRLACASIAVATWAASERPGVDFLTCPDVWVSLAMDPSTPPGRVTWALDALQMAAGKFQGVTGHDGLAVAQDAITQAHGAAVAEHVLRPLLKLRGEHAELEIEIDGLLYTGPRAPTADECAAAVAALVDAVFQGPRMNVLRARLNALQALPVDDGGGDDVETVQRAREAVGVACQDAFDAGVGVDEIRAALDLWSDATGGARVAVNAPR